MIREAFDNFFGKLAQSDPETRKIFGLVIVGTILIPVLLIADKIDKGS